MHKNRHLLIGCSFTDPTWQSQVPWSVEYAKIHPAYIVAKAGMGINGICTEAMYYLPTLPDIKTLVIILPTLWRLDTEVDKDTYLCNSMVDLLYCNQTWNVAQSATRKWITSGGLHYDKSTEQAKLFDFLYKHKGLLVIAKEHFRALNRLLKHCQERNIHYHISAIQDPLDQLVGQDYIKDDILEILYSVEYQQWFRFNGKFIDKFLGHSQHPTTNEHRVLCEYILDVTE